MIKQRYRMAVKHTGDTHVATYMYNKLSPKMLVVHSDMVDVYLNGVVELRLIIHYMVTNANEVTFNYLVKLADTTPNKV